MAKLGHRLQDSKDLARRLTLSLRLVYPRIPRLLFFFITVRLLIFALIKTVTNTRVVVYNIAPQLIPLHNAASRNILNSFLTHMVQEDYGAISSILFHASLHADRQRGPPTQWRRSTLYFRGETIRVLIEQLKANENVASDSSICMIGFLAASGNITGDIGAEDGHWNALRTMIDLRGGAHNLGWKGVLGLMLHM